MSVATDNWKVAALCLGILLLVPFAVLWFLSLGHIKLLSKWWMFLEKRADKILYG
jgi:hypothetical protein